MVFANYGVPLALLCLVLGCSSNIVKMDDATLTMVSNAGEIKAIHYSPESLFYLDLRARESNPGLTTAGLLGGALGSMLYVAMTAPDESTMDQMRNEYGIRDPVIIFKEHFIKFFGKNLKMTNFRSIPDSFSGDALTELDGAFHNGLVLDFRTMKWGVEDYSGFSSSTSVKYEGRVRLLAFPEAKILWQGTCPSPKMADGNMDELLENHANRLKEKFAYLAKQCASALTRQFDRKM